MASNPSTETDGFSDGPAPRGNLVDDTDVQEASLGCIILRVLRNFIEQRVNFQRITPKMSCMKEVIHRIHVNRDNREEAANIFFEHLEKSEELGKYQEFIEALRQSDYPLIVEAIENGKFCKEHEEHEKLISVFFSRITESIQPEAMSYYLIEKGVLSSYEGERIRNYANQESKCDAAFYLLMQLPCRSPDWYNCFLEVLWEFDHRNLVKDIDEKFYDKKTSDSSPSSASVEAVAPSPDPDSDHISDFVRPDPDLPLTNPKERGRESGATRDEDPSMPRSPSGTSDTADIQQKILCVVNNLNIRMGQVEDRMRNLEQKLDKLSQLISKN